jgi:hypothetical protein
MSVGGNESPHSEEEAMRARHAKLFSTLDESSTCNLRTVELTLGKCSGEEILAYCEEHDELWGYDRKKHHAQSPKYKAELRLTGCGHIRMHRQPGARKNGP